MTGLSVADIDHWKPGDVREVFHAARSRAEANQLAADGLVSLPVFGTWGGATAEAAKNAVEHTRQDLDADGREALAVAMAADRAADGIDAVQAKLAALRSDLDRAGLAIDPFADKVVAGAGFNGTAADLAAKQAQFQPRLNAIVGEATVIDEELAEAIEMADGQLPIPKGSPTIDRVGPDGLTAAQAGADGAQEQNRRDVFRQIYGRDPESANDWRMAEALDPHTYDPRYRGYESNIVVGRFKPVPGAGVYRQNMYIPGAEVQNFELNSRALPHMAGDNRGPSSIVPAESSRVSVYADLEHGILVVRQNPSMSTDGVDAGAGMPDVSVLQAANGALSISYKGLDPFEPGPVKSFVKLHGNMTVAPTQGGNVVAGGDVTQYPSIEAYQYHSDGTTTQLFDQRATTNQLGAAIGLLLPSVHVGASAPDLQQSWGDVRPPEQVPMTVLAPPGNPPTIHPAPVPAAPAMPSAAPPLPVPTPPPLPVPAR